MSPLLRRLTPISSRALAVLAICFGMLVSLVVVAQPASALTTSQLTSRVYAKVNQIRAAYHLPALKANTRLASAAAVHNAEMASHHVLTNRAPGEAALSTRIQRAGFSPSRAYENVGTARTQSGVLGQPNAMLQGAARRAQLLSRNVEYVGVSVRWDSAHRKYWLTVDFGHVAAPVTVTIANAVLAQLNAERRAHGLPALSMNAQLIASAHAHNHAMAAANTMSHQLPGELDFASRILRAGYNYQTAGENVGWNTVMTTSGALYLETIMYNEVPPNDGHRRNILSPNYRSVGIDILFDSAHNKMWLTEDFGSLMG